jgi:hypothetical protein
VTRYRSIRSLWAWRAEANLALALLAYDMDPQPFAWMRATDFRTHTSFFWISQEIASRQEALGSEWIGIAYGCCHADTPLRSFLRLIVRPFCLFA